MFNIDFLKNFKPSEIKRYLKYRLWIALLLVILAFIGVVLTDISRDWAWSYWKFIVPVYALFSIALSWLHPATEKQSRLARTRNAIFHWLGLVLVDILIIQFVEIGLVSPFVAGLTILTSLALATYLAGIYFDLSFIVIGIFLGLIAEASAFIEEYLSFSVLPIALIVAVICFYIYYHSHKQLKKSLAQLASLE